MVAAHEIRFRMDRQSAIGLNWHIFRPLDRDLVWHGGATAGFSSYIGLDERRHMAIVVLSNSTPSTVDDTADGQIGFHFLDGRVRLTPPPTVRQEIVVPPAVLERYVGVYQLPEVTVTITHASGGLMAQVEGQSAVRIYAESETEFFLKVVDAQIRFVRGPNGVATGLVWHQDGLDTPARKIR